MAFKTPFSMIVAFIRLGDFSSEYLKNLDDDLTLKATSTDTSLSHNGLNSAGFT